jgi:hypothetical protein
MGKKKLSLNPMMATAGVLELGLGVFSAFEEQNKYIDEVRQNTFENMISRRQTEMSNAYRQRAYGRSVDAAKEQQQFNADAAGRAYVTEQLRFDEQMAEFAFNNLNFQKQLAQELGTAAAGERYGKSAMRLAAADVLGQYGRNQEILSKSLASAARKSESNLQEISRQQFSADYAAYGAVREGPLMEMPAPMYQPGRGPNMALSIAGSTLGAAKTFFTGAKIE